MSAGKTASRLSGSVVPRSGLRFAVVGVPGDRRTTQFGAAARAAGHQDPRVVAWRDVLRGRFAFAPGEFVRIESPGEDPGTDRLLRDADDPTRVEGTALWYRRFTAAVRTVTRAAHRAGAVLSTSPDDLATLFDKRRCHARLAAAGVPVPPAPSGPVGGWREVRETLRAARISRAFVKPAHGSSASGVVALTMAGPGRIRATTSVETASDGRLFNSLRVRHLTSEPEVAALVDALAPDGLHVEQWLPKSSLGGGRPADLRVVVVAGRATHAVVRTSRHPMTNLHLGGARGDLDAARAAIRAAGGSFDDALDRAERAAACFPDTWCVGVDVLPVARWRRFAVCEVNAFGDLLPRLTGLPGRGAEDLDTYAAQVAAVATRAPAPGAARGAPTTTSGAPGAARDAPTTTSGAPPTTGEAPGVAPGAARTTGAAPLAAARHAPHVRHEEHHHDAPA